MTAPVAGLELPAPDLTEAELEAWASGFLAGHSLGFLDGYESGDLEYAAALSAWLTGHVAHEKVCDARAKADRSGRRPGDWAGNS